MSADIVITVFVVGIFFNFLINILLFLALPNFIKIDYYKGKWGKKKEPLYKLELEYWGNYYQVSKYIIYYSNTIAGENTEKYFFLIFGLIPFSGLFKFPCYEQTGISFGKFTKEDILKMENFNIGEYWEMKYKEELDSIKKEQLEEQQEENKIKEINKEFYEHY